MKILWIKSDFLYPPNVGGKIRSYNILKRLADTHDVSYLCLSEEKPENSDIDHLMEFCEEVEYIRFDPEPKFSAQFYFALLKNLFSSLPYVISKYDNDEIKKRIREYVRDKGVDIIVCDFLEMAINCMDLTDVPRVLFQHNVETEIWRRHYEINENPVKKGYLYIDYRKFYEFEKKACAHFDDVLVVSESDANLLEKDYDVPHTTVIPTGVDVDFFKPNLDKMEDDNIVFVGSMDWLPNQDAVEYFVKDILPLIKARKPNVRFFVVGRRAPERIKRLAKPDGSIVVTGTVDDVRPYVDRAAVYIVPIRIGGGTRLKIFEAMAQKKAIVSTTVGAEGLPLTDGEDIIIRDEADNFAEAVCNLIDDNKLSSRISGNAYKLVTEKYSWDNVARIFSDALEEALNRRHAGQPAGDIAGESRS